MKKVFLSLLLGLVVLGLSGCPSGGKSLKTEYVEGVVTLDGEILPGATVTFSPTGTVGEMASGITNDSGVYKLSSANGNPEKGAVAADYVVTVTKIKVTEYAEDDPKAPVDPVSGAKLTSSQEIVTPKIYERSATSPLKHTVSPGKNKIDLELKSN